jgi:phosphatidylglycerophosphate synthase
MTILALVLEETPVKLWGLSASERLRRQLQEAGGVKLVASPAELPDTGQVLLLNGHYLFEVRTLAGLLTKSNSLLRCPQDGGVAAAIVDAANVDAARDCMTGKQDAAAASLESITPVDLTAFNEALRSAQTPLLELVSEGRKPQLENRLYGNAYKGITDLVTKFLWPRPAKKAVHVAASLGVSPNMVTTLGLVLVLAACYLFLNGQYLAGLLAGWIMTLLDTVDGKLARVTVQSSKFGHLYDHLIDLFHPPFWYIYWGMSLGGFGSVLGFDQEQMYWMIIIGYVAGRIVEGIFPLLGNCTIFTWQPYDAWFRLVTARRNPCLVILTVSVVIGRPDWGFIAVTFWTVLTTMLMLVRLLQGLVARIRGGPLQSWLSADDVASGPNARAYRIFGSTRGAYEA